MSTAIMSRYDFGDNLMKTVGRESATGVPSGHFTLARMSSTPATTAAASNLTIFLGNLSTTSQTTQPSPIHRRLERTQSAPGPAAPSPAVNTSRYKTELCRPYEEFGVCKYGDKCQFAHGGAELRSLARHPKYKTELCRTYHTVGFCPYGPRCHFVHNQEEVLLQKTATRGRPRPAALSPALSLDGSAGSPCSQSPTSSMGSFFSSEPELSSPDERLPVFNRLAEASRMHMFNDLVM